MPLKEREREIERERERERDNLIHKIHLISSIVF